MLQNLAYKNHILKCIIALNHKPIANLDNRKLLHNILTANNTDLPEAILILTDYILQYELKFVKIINPEDHLITLYTDDITTLKADVIVNAANSQGLGCFTIGHKCIDNIIHSRAGPRLRQECKNILKGNQIKTGELISTYAYNLPCRYVFHVVGPIYNNNNKTTNNNMQTLLTNCYANCMNKLKSLNLHSIAFCCISTGEYGYPKEEASAIALTTIKSWMVQNNYYTNVIFCAYDAENQSIYKKNIGKFFNSYKVI